MGKAVCRGIFILLVAFEALGLFGLVRLASDFTWLGLIVTAAFAWAVLEFFKAPLFVWVLALVAVLLDVTSALFLLYSRIPPWDRYVHTWGGLVVAVGVLDLVLRALEKKYIQVHKKYVFIIGSVFTLVAFIGFLYEFLEYLVDQFHYHAPVSLVSAYNSIEDQLFNLLGAALVLAVFCGWEFLKQRRTGTGIR